MLTVGAFATFKPVTIPCATPIGEARKTMRARRIHHLPVTKYKKLVGIVSDRDLRSYEGRVGDDVPVEEVMTPFAYTVAHDTPVSDVAARMAKSGYGSVLVRGKRGTLGIFTTVDALHALAHTARALPLADDREVTSGNGKARAAAR